MCGWVRFRERISGTTAGQKSLLPRRRRCPTTIFRDPGTDIDIISAQHFWTGGLKTAGPGCYGCCRDRSGGGFPNAGYEPHPSCDDCSLNRSEPAKKSGQNIPKNRCRTTIAEQMMETLAELPLIGDQLVCLSHEPSRPQRNAIPRAGARPG